MTSIKASVNTKQTALRLKSAQDNKLIAELKKKINETENNNISLNTQLDTAINNVGSQAKKISALSQSTVELSAIQSEYKVRSNENSELKKNLFDCETTSKTLKGQLDMSISNAAVQAKKLTTLNQSVAELTTLKEAYQERNNENTELEKQLLKSNDASKTLKAQLEMATSNAADEARKQAAQSQSAAELTALKSAYKERDDENATLKMKLNDMQNMQITIDATKAEMIELQNKLNESENARKNLIGKISTLEKKSSDQTRKITELMITTSGLDELKSAYRDLSSNKVESNTQLEAATADTDKDGIFDVSDKCPASPEGSKVNAFGCPDIQDADNDGVADADDLCPDSEIGMKVNEFGCVPTQNITLKGVNFTIGSARLTSDSLPIINAAAETLKRNPKLNIEIAGYTDNQGLAYVNKRLSERRANSVMNQLIKQGVEANRLTANGYGEKDPVSSNETDEGRATNRRVELKIRE